MQQQIDGLPEPEKHKAPDINEGNVDGWIDEMVGVFTDPVVCMPSGVGDRLPEKIREDITMYRLIQQMQRHRGDPEGELATWPEVCWYLSTASLEFPFDHDWTQIYLYSFTQYYGDKTPEDLRVDKLDQSQVHDLNRFRSWLYNSRVKGRKARLQGERREKREQAKAEKTAKAEKAEAAQQQIELFFPDEYEAIARR